MDVNSLPKTVTRQRRDCDFNPGPSAPESSTLTTRLPSHPGVGNVQEAPDNAGAHELQAKNIFKKTIFPGISRRRSIVTCSAPPE